MTGSPRIDRTCSHDGKSHALSIIKNAGFGASGSVLSIFLKLAIGVVVARALGPESFGIYVLAISIIMLAEVLSLLGLENGIVKFVSQFKTLNDIPRLKGTIFGGVLLTFAMSILVGLGIFVSAELVTDQLFHKPTLIPVLRIMAISLPFSAFTVILLASLQGAKLIKYKVIVNQILVPFSRLFCVVVVLVLGYRLKGVACAYLLAVVIGTCCSCYYLLKRFPKIIQKGTVIFEKKKITMFSLPLLFAGIFKRIHARSDIILLGYFLSAPMVGMYGVAQRILPLVAIPLVAFNNIFAPIIAELFANERHEELQHQYKVVTRWIITSTLPIFALTIYFSKEILHIFGPGYGKGYWVVIILCIGQMLNAATGSAGFMLMMTGRSLANLVNSALVTVTAIILNIYLIPKYGIVGAALAYTTAIAGLEVLRLAEIWHYLKIHPYQLATLKPIVSCTLSVLVLLVISHLEVNTNHLIMVPLLCLIFFTSYVLFLLLFRLSPEDRMVVSVLKEKLLQERNHLLATPVNPE